MTIKTKKELIELIASDTGIKKTYTQAVIEALGRITEEDLIKSGEALIPSVGKVIVTQKEAREARHPSTGETIQVAASKGLKFRFTGPLKAAVNK